ncbi:hypothetical protein [Bradyrhizobium commune]|uniref:Uncharacterized protein n=1 Tax=Bradyrhizobium commune TaxID=83627 RepID=A0A7S9CZX9_9BRAD|nr:hypothetical protein [Bradyrhizobium commune]QPF88647.1 hypothetical protein IC761_19120 [Bradyrhizobium commune]
MSFIETSSDRRSAGLGEHGRAPRGSAAKPLDLGGDQNLANALRRCEDTFNEDVLPRDARLREPREFYSAPDMGCPPRSRKQTQSRQDPPVATSTSHAHAAA